MCAHLVRVTLLTLLFTIALLGKKCFYHEQDKQKNLHFCKVRESKGATNAREIKTHSLLKQK